MVLLVLFFQLPSFSIGRSMPLVGSPLPLFKKAPTTENSESSSKELSEIKERILLAPFASTNFNAHASVRHEDRADHIARTIRDKVGH
jgi:hypothetical protein